MSNFAEKMVEKILTQPADNKKELGELLEDLIFSEEGQENNARSLTTAVLSLDPNEEVANLYLRLKFNENEPDQENDFYSTLMGNFARLNAAMAVFNHLLTNELIEVDYDDNTFFANREYFKGRTSCTLTTNELTQTYTNATVDYEVEYSVITDTYDLTSNDYAARCFYKMDDFTVDYELTQSFFRAICTPTDALRSLAQEKLPLID